MTKKDYELIASAIREATTIPDKVGMNAKDIPAYLAGIAQTMRNLSFKLKEDNSDFKFDKFEKACGF